MKKKKITKIYVISTEITEVDGIVGLNNGWYTINDCENYGDVQYARV